MNDTIDHKQVFDEVIGQERAKGFLGFHLDAYDKTRQIPNLLFSAPKGQGKTTLARCVGKCLKEFDPDGNVVLVQDSKGKTKPKRKGFVEINCGGLPNNVGRFINEVIIRYVQDKDVTILLDEAHAIPPKVETALLTMMNTESGHITQYAHEEYVCEINFKRQSFLFATTEVQDMCQPLVNRLKRVDLQDYTYGEMSKIVEKHSPEVKFKDNVLNEIVTVLRGNARDAKNLSNDIKTYLTRGKTENFTKKDWEELKRILGIYPLGLNPTEITILRYLADNNQGVALTTLAAKTGLTREAVQRDYEMFLRKHDLMTVDTSGRIITPKGLAYLRDLGTGSNPTFRSSVVQKTKAKAKS